MLSSIYMLYVFFQKYPHFHFEVRMFFHAFQTVVLAFLTLDKVNPLIAE